MSNIEKEVEAYQMIRLAKEKVASVAETLRVEAEELTAATRDGVGVEKLDALVRDIEGDVERLRGEMDIFLRRTVDGGATS